MAKPSGGSAGNVPVASPLPPCTEDNNPEAKGREATWVVPGVSGSDRGYISASDPDVRAVYPVLSDFMTLNGIRGKGRKTGSLLFFCEDGMVKACLNDRDSGAYCFLSSKSVAGLLDALEKGLKGGSLEWRVKKGK